MIHPSIEKHRYLWKEDRLLWEIDEFEGLLAGLIIAEVELESEEMEINIPSWAGMELTYLKGWSNAELVRMIGQEKVESLQEFVRFHPQLIHDAQELLRVLYKDVELWKTPLLIEDGPHRPDGDDMVLDR